jgi:hypothetical protein
MNWIMSNLVFMDAGTRGMRRRVHQCGWRTADLAPLETPLELPLEAIRYPRGTS